MGTVKTMLHTQRLILRKWTQADADSLFEYASSPEVGPVAGWPAHKSAEESRNVIKNALNGAECYAICEKENNIAIGSAELKLNGHTDMTQREDECELGYWLGKPFWGRGYMPEAAQELLRHAFEDLGMRLSGAAITTEMKNQSACSKSWALSFITPAMRFSCRCLTRCAQCTPMCLQRSTGWTYISRAVNASRQGQLSFCTAPPGCAFDANRV